MLNRLKSEWSSGILPVLVFAGLASGLVDDVLVKAKHGIHRSAGWIHEHTSGGA